ncbi:hypothetical protein ABT072_02660 [Streptomyces sp. NPDC002589]|uniref:RipA family octameric membrane protein n=1 Tax=Streptomyces sp. NPDC002589 TaxID=3154420 RepID=UPI0033287882
MTTIPEPEWPPETPDRQPDSPHPQPDSPRPQPETPGCRPETLDRRSELLELYKLAVEMADRVSARRGTANAFFLSVQSTLVTLVGFGSPSLEKSPWWVPLAVALTGVTLSGAWWLQLRSYRDLNSAKFKVIHALEDHLPARIMADEWDLLKRHPMPGRRNRYAELGTSERIVPLVFAAAHLILFGGTLSV